MRATSKAPKTPTRSVSAGLFNDPKMWGTSAVAKCLFVYLLMESVTAISRRSIRQMGDIDRRLTDDEIRAALQELVGVGVAKWDAQHELVWVVNGLRHQTRGQPNNKLGIHVRNHLANLPRSPLVTEFESYYSKWLVDSGALEQQPSPQLRLLDGGQGDSERRIAAAFEAAMPGGNTPEAMRGALALYYEHEATVEEIVRVVEWWRQHGRAEKIYLKDCFERFGKRAAWARVSVLALGREPQSPKKRKPDAGIDSTRAAFRRHIEGA